MILYTIQEEFKWKEFQETGILKADNNIICCEDFNDSYAWIEKKMKELLPTSDIECKHPVWAWFKYSGKNKPDLRRRHLEKGKIGYRIEFEIDDNKVLLTDFSDWHLVLNRSQEDIKLEHCCLDIEDDDDLIEYQKEGWVIKDNKIMFDWNNIILDKNSNKEDIQATLWYIRMYQVKSAKKFKSR